MNNDNQNGMPPNGNNFITLIKALLLIFGLYLAYRFIVFFFFINLILG